MTSALEKSLSTVYTEEPTELHTNLTRDMWKRFSDKVGITREKGGLILDFGCGMGVAIPHMQDAGLLVVALTPNEKEAERVTFLKAIWTRHMPILDRSYNYIWARHSLEHTINPFEVLCDFHRILADDGAVYVEVPSPDTPCLHELNQNHYSVLGETMWQSLFSKSGFRVTDAWHTGIDTPIGRDVYFSYILRKNDE